MLVIDLDHGACRSVDPLVFLAQDDVAVAHAKSVCASCEVRLDCLALALSTGHREGVWGGLTAGEREPFNTEQDKPPTRQRQI
jgi:WhiB family transcriptional regulator, redox-sensing transcriptional regulator